MEPTTRLAKALQSGRLALTIEYVPPPTVDGEAVAEQAATLPATVDAVVVSDNRGEIGASALACSSILVAQGKEPVLTVSTRDRNRIALQSDVLGAAMLGVVNVLCLSGEHQSLGTSPEAAGAFDIDSVQFLQALRMMRDEGVLLSGRPLQSKPSLFVGAAAYPYLRPLELALIGLRKKVEAGAQFLVTQPVFDVDGFAEWMAAVRKAGLHERTHILTGARPLASSDQAERLRAPDSVTARLRNSADPIREGVSICADIVAQVRSIEGVRGIHFHSGSPDGAVAGVIQQAGLSPS